MTKVGDPPPIIPAVVCLNALPLPARTSLNFTGIVWLHDAFRGALDHLRWLRKITEPGKGDYEVKAKENAKHECRCDFVRDEKSVMALGKL